MSCQTHLSFASDQVDPSGANTNTITSGWFGALAKAYPQAVKKGGMGGENDPSVLEPEREDEYGAEAQGWKVLDFQEPPISVTDWAPYIEEVQSKGVEALWPSLDDNIVPYFQAMTTAGYHPAFVILGVQFYNSTTSKGVADNPGLSPVYVETSSWPLEMASQNPSTEQLLNVMHTYAKGDAVDFDDEEGAESWLLWAKSASACGADLTVSCVLSHAAATKDWDAGGIESPVAQCHVRRGPSALTVLRPAEGRAQQVRLRQGDHAAHPVHLELQPEQRRPPDPAATGFLSCDFVRGPSHFLPRSSAIRPRSCGTEVVFLAIRIKRQPDKTFALSISNVRDSQSDSPPASPRDLEPLNRSEDGHFGLRQVSELNAD